MTFAQRRNRLTTHFSERNLVVKRRISVCQYTMLHNIKRRRVIVKGTGKASPVQSWTGPEVPRRMRFPDFKTTGTWKWWGCQPYAPAAYTPRKYSWYSFVSEAESTSTVIVRPNGLCQWKIPVIPSGIESATFRLVAQCIRQGRHRACSEGRNKKGRKRRGIN